MIEGAFHLESRQLESSKKNLGLPGDLALGLQDPRLVLTAVGTTASPTEPPSLGTCLAALSMWCFVSWSQPASQMYSGLASQYASVVLSCILTEAWFTGSANANGLKKEGSTRCYCK